MPVIDAKEGSQLDLDIAALLDSPPDRQEQLLRRILVERLDFETASGSVSILRQRVAGIPDAATRIASLDGMQALFVTLPTGKITATVAKAIIKELSGQVGDHLLIARTDDGSVLHFISPRSIGKRIVLRRIVLERGRPRRTAVERLFVLYDARARERVDARTAIERAFDVEAVTREFYTGYEGLFRHIEAELVTQSRDQQWAHDYALQLLNRVMFLYFIDRKGWLESDFLKRFWRAYRQSGRAADTFFDQWLKVLFFEAFNNKFSHPSYMPQEISDTLQMAPYLNGGLFERNRLDEKHDARVDDDLWQRITRFFDSYNFTVAESTPWDQEVAVDPEMIGKVYESLVNVSEIDERGQAGIFYTPRTEIDLMCRLSLVDYLANHLGEEQKTLLYNTVFAVEQDEKDDADRQLRDNNLWPEFDDLIREMSVVDPACGSGSFLVGMLQVLNDLSIRANRELGRQESPYERKKRIIGQSLYGVDVMQWAVNVAELRLWLQLIIDTDIPEGERIIKPLLPNLSFKVRCGDSLVQEVGGVNMSHLHGRSELPAAVKGQITRLKGEKLRFFNNEKGHLEEEALQREELGVFRAALDKQIDAIGQQLRQKKASLDAARVQQGQLAGIARERGRQATLEETRLGEEIERLEAQVAEAKKARDALAPVQQPPFVWDIAFVEVFSGESEGFDIVIGNPPYVRQEKIADPDEDRDISTPESRKAYKAKLMRAVYAAYPRFFGYNVRAGTVTHKADAKSDLYIYFYFLSLSLLNEKGSFCFITSNSWLDVGYGADLQEFLLTHSHVKMVLDNQLKRSFANADVNTIIVLLAAPDDSPGAGLSRTARFVTVKVPFEQIISPVIFEEIEEADERRMTPEYRGFPTSQRALLEEGTDQPAEDEEEPIRTRIGPLTKITKYTGNKWGGKYLRAPDIYAAIIDEGKDRMVALGSLAKVKRGITSGADDWFYLTHRKANELGIERRFLKPILTDPGDSNLPGIVVSPEAADLLVIDVHEEKSDLRGTRLLAWIQVGEAEPFQGRGGSFSIPANRPSVSGRRRWYELPYRSPAPILWIEVKKRRSFTAVNEANLLVDRSFYDVVPAAQVGPRVLCALLNSTFVALQCEILGNAPGGSGAGVQMPCTEVRRLLLPSPQLFDDDARCRLMEAFDEMCSRRIGPLYDDVLQKDRQQLDSVVFQMLGLNERDLEKLYTSVSQMIRDRLDRSASLSRGK